MRVDFYHLTRDPAAPTAALLASKTLEAGKRMLIVCADAGRREAIADALWQADGFLANGEAGEDAAARQPILLAGSPATPANAATFVALADGVWRDEALAFDRAFLLFDEATIAGARTAWKALAARDGCERHYWKFEDGRWREGP